MRASKRAPIPRVVRDAVLMRDGDRCRICGHRVDPTNLHIDHWIPVFRGGATTVDNLRVTHALCNLRRRYNEAGAFPPAMLCAEAAEWEIDPCEYVEPGFFGLYRGEDAEELQDFLLVYDEYQLPPMAPDDRLDRALAVGEVLP